jgi:hypothetical protein
MPFDEDTTSIANFAAFRGRGPTFAVLLHVVGAKSSKIGLVIQNGVPRQAKRPKNQQKRQSSRQSH